ncbi:Glycine--tRNA ligase beta subunit [Gossypium arboreum]|uniref:Glycine--tRNA ligase beta subunit n=1 Tax=Gossypium arboreum TaxID=29729 RepID=A0A0B0PQ25_GOSAR|nr:Glycine--tRNA ligase beta subunit [Gossypium arboreum]
MYFKCFHLCMNCVIDLTDTFDNVLISGKSQSNLRNRLGYEWHVTRVLCYVIQVLVLYILPVAEYIVICYGYLTACVSSTE